MTTIRREKILNQPYELQLNSGLINNKYKVVGKIGSGTNSSVYSISMTKGQKTIIRAIKVEKESVKQPQISTQVSILSSIKESMRDEIGFCKMYEYGFETDYNYLIMTILGPNLKQLANLCGGNLSLKTTLILALQILDRIQSIHELNYIYGDIKPQNFLMGLGADSIFVHMIDFGKCKKYRNKNEHILYKQNVANSYDHIFASVNAHHRLQYSRRDDIESFLYMIIYLRLGKLPWKVNQAKKEKKVEEVQEIKKKVTPEMLCHKMPLQFIDLVYYTKTLQFYEKPDYNFIRKKLFVCLNRQDFDYDIVYDWNKLSDIQFKIYNGQPKIILKKDQEQLIESESEKSDKTQQTEKTEKINKEVINEEKESQLIEEKLI